MKSAADILSRVGTIKPNTLTEYLTDYLIAIELRVQKDLLNIKNPVYNASSLSLDSPEDTVYELYLFAVIDFLNGEFGRYENTLSAFTSAWEALVANYVHKDNSFTDSDGSNDEKDDAIYDRRFKLW